MLNKKHEIPTLQKTKTAQVSATEFFPNGWKNKPMDSNKMGPEPIAIHGVMLSL